MDSPYYTEPSDENKTKDPEWYRNFIGSMWEEMGNFNLSL